MKTAIALLAAIGVTSAAFAQDTQPAAPMPMPVQNAPGGPDPFDKLVNSDGPTDYPKFEMRSVPIAKARAVQTRLEYDRANVALTGTAARLWDDLFSAPAYLSAVAEERQAHDRYVAARNEALKSLNDNSRYLALIKLRDDLLRKTRELNGDPSASQDDIVAAASLKLDYAKAAGDIERDVLAKDSIYLDAQAKLLAAGAKRQAIHSSFARDVRKSQDFLAAREMKEDARIRYLVADSFLQSTLENRRLAMRYAYFLHGLSPDYYTNTSYSYGYGNSAYGGYGYGGYGFGYGNYGVVGFGGLNYGGFNGAFTSSSGVGRGGFPSVGASPVRQASELR